MSEWRKIDGIENYEFSFNGKDALCRSGLKWRGQTGRLLSTNRGTNKYVAWNIYVDGKCLHKQAAWFIAKAFPEFVQNEYFEGAEIDHIDTDRLNNHPSNLRWVDKKGQMNNELTKEHIRSLKIGEGNPMYGKSLSTEHKNKISKSMTNNPLKSFKVSQYTKNGEIINTYVSMHEAHRQTGIPFQSIAACVSGVRNTAGGFVWKHGEQS